ncbi:hypothetical protein DLM45_10860 [Hyphomicrobium methylovorum]|uniref:hypothetical protein n=1 Tax=Hyphomicrobium methylovorum TaxID=84 RepID=UPI0015E7AE15|nr:hypothetical protein [Hyphomicrobium methylovorum]MBA2126712.1 hypothetical protein [Hyphomicrobium methylovorum]
MKVVSTRDPERELRSFRKANPRVCGIAMTIYVQNEVVAGRVIARGLELLEQSGKRRDGRWVGCKPTVLEAVLRDAADAIGASVLSTTERLLKGQRLLEQEAARR